MKSFIIVSDTHGNRNAIEKLKPLIAENDYFIHLGDGVRDGFSVQSEFPEKAYLLQGNCDMGGGVRECVIEAEGLSIFCCHGDAYGVKSGLSRLAARAKQRDCEIALYGHTHRAAIETVNGVLCINAGSAGSKVNPSYCYLVIHNKKPTATIVDLR